MEVPQYTLRPNTNRMVMPWVFKLLGLSILFYAGIYLNAKFVLNVVIPNYVNILIIVFLVVLVIAQLILYRIRFRHFLYEFYTNRVDFIGKEHSTFIYGNFENITLKQNVFDKVFNTGIIKLSKTFEIGPVSNVSQIKIYLEQLIKYYQYTQQRTKMLQQQASTGTSRIQSQVQSQTITQNTSSQLQYQPVSQSQSQSQSQTTTQNTSSQSQSQPQSQTTTQITNSQITK